MEPGIYLAPKLYCIVTSRRTNLVLFRTIFLFTVVSCFCTLHLLEWQCLPHYKRVKNWEICLWGAVNHM